MIFKTTFLFCILSAFMPLAHAAEPIPFTPDPIELVDYIFDRYAYLGLTPEATKEEIGFEIKKRKVQNHPDRLTQLDADLQERARQNWERALECERVLSDDNIRPLYNERLNEFRANKPHLISDDGTPIIDINRNFIDISLMMSGFEFNFSKAEEHAEMFTHHKAKEFERAQKMYKANPEDPDFIAMYRDALERKLRYTETMDFVLWSAAGVHGDKFMKSQKPIMDPALIGESTIMQIEHVHSEIIPAAMQARGEFQALGYDKNPLLLLTHDKSSGEALPTIDLKPSIEIAQSRFRTLSEAIKQNAIEKGRTLESLLELSPFEVLHSVNSDSITVYLFDDTKDSHSLEDAEVIAIVKFVNGAVGMQDFQTPLTIADLRNTALDHTAVAVLLNREAGDPSLNLGYAFKRAMRLFGNNIELEINVK